jgi:osmotically-inducible protein OsmY
MLAAIVLGAALRRAAVASAPRRERTSHGDDERLRERLQARLANETRWCAPLCNVFVADGQAILQGLFLRRRDRLATAAIVRSTPGVRAVIDRRVRQREWQALG